MGPAGPAGHGRLLIMVEIGTVEIGTADAAGRFGHLIREWVTVTFADGQQESGVLVAAHADVIEVEHIDITGGGHIWTATYTLIGDDDTPRVIDVARYESPDMPHEHGELFA